MNVDLVAGVRTDRRLAPGENEVTVTGFHEHHAGRGHPVDHFEPEDLPVKGLTSFGVAYGNGEMHHTFGLDHEEPGGSSAGAGRRPAAISGASYSAHRSCSVLPARYALR